MNRNFVVFLATVSAGDTEGCPRHVGKRMRRCTSRFRTHLAVYQQESGGRNNLSLHQQLCRFVLLLVAIATSSADAHICSVSCLFSYKFTECSVSFRYVCSVLCDSTVLLYYILFPFPLCPVPFCAVGFHSMLCAVLSRSLMCCYIMCYTVCCYILFSVLSHSVLCCYIPCPVLCRPVSFCDMCCSLLAKQS